MDSERALVLSVCLIALVLGACTVSVDSGETQEAPIEPPDMEAYWAAHVAARQSGDLDAALAILAEDAVLYEPFAPPVAGLDKIAPKMKAALTMTEIHEVSFDSREVYHHGGWLVDRGSFSETFSLQGREKRYSIEGSYFAVLEQDAGGEWKVKRFMAMPSTPPPSGLMEAAAAASGEAGP